MTKNEYVTYRLSYACAIIMHFSEDRGVGIIFLPTKFRLHRFINNGDLLSDRNHWKHTHRDTHTETDTRPIYKGRVKTTDKTQVQSVTNTSIQII